MSAEIYLKPNCGTRVRFIMGKDAIAKGDTKIGPSLYREAVPVAPSATAPPSIAGSPTVGSVLTVTPGTYTGTPTPNITRQWKNGGADIVGETGTTLDTTGLSASDSITVVETATNTAGSDTATSNAIVLT